MGRRIAAWLLDALLAGGAVWVVFFLVADKVPSDAVTDSSSHANFTLNGDSWQLQGAAATLFLTLSLAAPLLYWGVLPGMTGWTPGKRLLGLRLVRADGSLPGAGRGVVRGLFWAVDGFPYFLPGLVGFVVAMSSSRRQRVGDQVARTFVVRAGSAPESEERPLAPDAAPGTAAAGWYADPRGEQRLRYWDGQGWTAHVAP